eukprot:995094-Pelagomonas_calceolata.AAC.1
MVTHILPQIVSAHQLRKQILYPEKHIHHVQGDVLKKISNLARASQDNIFFYKASLKDGNLIDTGIPSAGSGGNPFHNTTWLAREETDPRPPQPHPSSPRL